MARPVIKTLLLAFLACIVVSCGSDDRMEGALSAGILSIEVETDGEVRTFASGSSGSMLTSYALVDGTVSLTMSSQDGAYSYTWNDVADFTQDQAYLAGTYHVEVRSGDPSIEGFDIPAFYGEADVQVAERSSTRQLLSMSIANALLKIEFTADAVDAFASIDMLVHTPGGVYHKVSPDEERYLCLNPGSIELILNMTLSDGRTVSIPAGGLSLTEAATLYAVSVDVESASEGPCVSVETYDGVVSTVITEELVNAAEPTVMPSWDTSAMLELPEGSIPQESYSVAVTSVIPLTSLRLSTQSKSLEEKGWPDDVDLLNISAEQEAVMRSLGFDFDVTYAGGNVDFTALLGRLVYLDSASDVSSFSIVAVCSDGKVSQPVGLQVRSTPVEISVENVMPVTMGIDRARVDVRCEASGFTDHVEIEIFDAESDNWVKVEDCDIESLGAGLYSLTFGVPLESGPVSVRVLYCEEVRATISVPREMPPFIIEVDPYATSAVVRIIPDDATLTKAITSEARIYINGYETPVYQTDSEEGLLTVIGLSPSTKYSFKATMMSGVDSPEFTSEVSVTTESTPQLPNSDFEERTDGIKYKNLPSGGRYAQTVVEIFNWQHHTTIDQEVPKEWANTNAKTFAMSSTNHNTWYMQPSVALTRDNVFSQSFAVTLASVAFDPAGQPIPDYAQTGQPYLDYSPVVPDISYRAAGKLFLGQYEFDPATMREHYSEGIEWHSRPTSLNGYYRFYPCDGDRSDCGLALVEVLGVVDGEETVIASGESRLTLASSYTAFNVPLSYSEFGVKATRIKVMFSSSSNIGTIEEESRSVVTVADARTASSVGGRLWVDNVTLAY